MSENWVFKEQIMVKKIFFILFLTISTIGFSQEKSIDDLSAAPNPFANSTKITFTAITDEDITLEVKNVLGKSVFKKEYKVTKGKNTIDFYKNELQSGIYIYRIQDSKNLISKRFVIK